MQTGEEQQKTVRGTSYGNITLSIASHTSPMGYGPLFEYATSVKEETHDVSLSKRCPTVVLLTDLGYILCSIYTSLYGQTFVDIWPFAIIFGAFPTNFEAKLYNISSYAVALQFIWMNRAIHGRNGLPRLEWKFVSVLHRLLTPTPLNWNNNCTLTPSPSIGVWPMRLNGQKSPQPCSKI